MHQRQRRMDTVTVANWLSDRQNESMGKSISLSSLMIPKLREILL